MKILKNSRLWKFLHLLVEKHECDQRRQARLREYKIAVVTSCIMIALYAVCAIIALIGLLTFVPSEEPLKLAFSAVALILLLTAILVLCHSAKATSLLFLMNIELSKPMTADHGRTLLEVIEGIRNEPVAFVAIFSTRVSKIRETTQLWRFCSEACVCAARGIGPSWERGIIVFNKVDERSGISGYGMEIATKHALGTEIIVTRNFVHVITLTPENQIPHDEIAKLEEELEDAWQDALAAHRYSRRRRCLRNIAAARQIFERYGIRYECYPYRMFIRMLKELAEFEEFSAIAPRMELEEYYD